MKSQPGPPMTLGNAAARVRLIAWCLPFGEPHGFAGCPQCRYQVEPAAASHIISQIFDARASER